MSGFHNSDGSLIGAAGFTNSGNISVASAASAGTKGAYTQLIASTTYDADGIIVILNWGTSGRIQLVDIAIGAGGSEVVVAGDLPYEQIVGTQPTSFVYYLPVQIPAGSRIAARANISGATTKNVGVTVYPISSSFLGLMELSQVQTYGFTTTPALTGITASGTINTKGSYAQLIASTTYDIKAVIPVFGKVAAPASASDYRVDFAVGGSGSEVVFLPDMYTGFSNVSTSHGDPTTYPPIPMDIPSGTRLSARCQSSVASATLDVALIGLS